MNNYDLSFISDADLFSHVQATVEKYRFTIDPAEFNKNIIDPIKLTFDAKVYDKSIQDVVESEILRQLDKSILITSAIFTKISLNISVMAGAFLTTVLMW